MHIHILNMMLAKICMRFNYDTGKHLTISDRVWEYIYFQHTGSNIYLIEKLTGRIKSSPPGQDGRHFAHDIFIFIFVNEKLWILDNIWLKFIP